MVRSAVQQRGRVSGLGLPLDVLPLGGEPGDVAIEFGLGGSLGRGAHDHPGVLRGHLLEDVLETVAFGVRELAADPRHRRAGHVDQVPAGKAHHAGQPRPLVPHRVLGDLHDHRLTRLERGLDALGLALQPASVEVDLAGVEHRVAPLADVDEGGLHRGQHVLHLAQVHVADVRLVRRPVDVMLHEDAVLEDRDLGAIAALPHDHRPVDGFPPGQELRLGDHRRAAPAGLTALAPALLLGLQARGPLDGPYVVRRADWFAHVHHGVRRVIGRGHVGIRGTTAALAPPAPACGRAIRGLGVGVTL
jgi:hypothetical protein